jgi:hypothetical protein
MALVNKETYGIRKDIMIGVESYYIALPAQVTNTGISADSDGKKILRAGTPVSGDITKRDTAFVKASTSSGTSNATAIVLHDVDVTDGANNATIVLAGCIDTLKLDTATKALVTAEVKTALPRIIFVEGSAI